MNILADLIETYSIIRTGASLSSVSINFITPSVSPLAERTVSWFLAAYCIMISATLRLFVCEQSISFT